jgi:Na+:H+ antiporter, NhaA family
MKPQPSKYFESLPEGNALTGVILIACTVLSLLCANLIFGKAYVDFWHLEIGDISILHFVNDGLMSLFFLVVGLEIKKELLVGELQNLKKALLPFLCAAGGMIVPAIIYYAMTIGTTDTVGWGIPTATDIAFSIGILAILGSKIRTGLKVFLTALAIIDDLGAVIVIALFYSQEISFFYLFLAIGATSLLWIIFERYKTFNFILWCCAGGVIWLCLYFSGIHSTIAGVLLAIVTPTNFKQSKPLETIATWLHKPVNYFIIPLFAIANTAFIVNGDLRTLVTSNISIGIIAGLFIGKPLGIISFAYVSVKAGLAELPIGVNWKILLGAAMLAGIGFTMSIFVSFLAFADPYRQDVAKIAILLASFIAGVSGLVYLHFVLSQQDANHKNRE